MIRFDHVSKTYSKTIHALEDINFSIEPGEFVFVVGPSGAGKTSLVKLILKEEDPTEGNIYIDGKDINRLRRSQVCKLRQKIGVVYQDFRLLESKNVFDNIGFALDIHGFSKSAKRRRVGQALRMLDLVGRDKAYPHELSGGEQQRVSMARAIVNRPKILIADEPTGNLDPDSAREVVKALLDINKLGATVIMITHSKDIVNHMAKRVIRLEEGRIVSDEDKGSYQ